jgi:hypothetical protein
MPMPASSSWLILLVGLGFYLYIAWFSSDAAARSATNMVKLAALCWALAAGAAVYAWFWGTTRGLSAYQIFFVGSTPGKLQNWVGTAYSLAVVAVCFSAHALVAFLISYGRRAKIDI